MSASKLELSAPAKVNLSLRILGRRADGFHEIETLMAPISLADRIVIELCEKGLQFSCDDPTLPTDDSNLVVKAARLFFAEIEREPCVTITLSKRIPSGAGLGGGSSDGATTLMGLNELHGEPISGTRLNELAATLGSDVPFFLHYSAAVCRGRGEIVTPTTLPRELPVLLLKPPFPVATAWAYKHVSTRKEEGAPAVPIDGYINDLEPPVFGKYLFLRHLKTWLQAQPETVSALMSGSGSTLFAILNCPAEGNALSERAQSEFGSTLWTSQCVTVGK